MEKVFIINLYNYNNELAYGNDLKIKLEILDEIGAIVESVEELSQCQRCGIETKELVILGSDAGCEDCEKSYYETQQRANEYMNESWNPYDNDYD